MCHKTGFGHCTGLTEPASHSAQGSQNKPALSAIVCAQADKQVFLSGCLEKLMTDVQRNLEPKNRDRFTQVFSAVLVLHFCMVHELLLSSL